MDCKSPIKNSKNNGSENNLKENKSKMQINPQLMMKINLNKIIDYEVGENTYRNDIIIIYELSNKKFGILCNYALLIYSLNNVKLLQMIEQDFKSRNDNSIKNFELNGFIELKNCNLVLWNKEKY